jgi:hypothetical protein
MNPKSIHRPLLTTLALVASIAAWRQMAPADEPAAPPEATPNDAEALFDQHAERGTLFLPETSVEFLRNKWGRQFADLVRTKWRGRSEARITLALKPLPEHTYRVGQAFDCLATISNESDKSQTLDIGGTCGTTHALGLLVIPAHGAVGHGYCRGKVGGPHCFCHSRFVPVEPGGSAALETGFASDAAVSWNPTQPGQYLLIGTYNLSTDPAKPAVAYSPPLVIDVLPAE